MSGQALAGESCSSCVYNCTYGSHLFQIRGYSLAKGVEPGEPVSSDTFSVGGYDWAIHFYPQGCDSEDDSEFVSAYITLVTKAANVRATYELTLLDQSGNDKHLVLGHRTPVNFNYYGEWPMWGYSELMLRSDFEGSNYVKNDLLQVRGRIGVVKSKRERSEKLSIDVPPSNMAQSLIKFLNSGIASDIVFNVGEETIEAHKMILAARSTVFQAQFYGLVGNPNLDKVVVEDMDPSVFKAMLNFIYSDSLTDLDESVMSSTFCCQSSTSTQLSDILFLQLLLAAADRYALDRLRVFCESKLTEKLTVDSVATTLLVAEQHGCSNLKSMCLRFAASHKNLEAVLNSNSYDHLKKSLPDFLSDLLVIVVKLNP